MSHPVWVRGLKPQLCMNRQQTRRVAPRVGAWIETVRLWFRLVSYLVAPRVGAWIETSTLPKMGKFAKSHPVWVRGLKPSGLHQSNELPYVAPRVGAWIETRYFSGASLIASVAPRVGAWIETFKLDIPFYDNGVAPRVGAWIETNNNCSEYRT